MPPCQGGCREFEPRLPLIKTDGLLFICFNLEVEGQDKRHIAIQSEAPQRSEDD